MKKIMIITVLLTASLFGYSQNFVILEEDFTANTIPAEWYVGNPGTGTELWSFGSNHVSAMGGSVAYDFSSNAAIFDDDNAGNAGQHDWTRLTYPITPGLLDLSSYSNSVVKLSYEYALNVSSTGSEALRVGIYDHANATWRIVVEYDEDTTPTFDSINLSDVFETYPGINKSDMLFCFEYDDIDGSWGFGAGVDNVKIYVEEINQYCENAIPVTVAPHDSGCPSPTTASNIGAMSSEATQGTPGCGGFSGGDIFYSFVAPYSGSIKIVLPNGSQDWSSISMALYNDCSENTEITCRNTIDDEVIENLTPGNNYLLRLWDYNNDDFGNVDFCIEESPVIPSNDEAVNSIPIIVEPMGAGCATTTLLYNTYATDSSPINGTPACGNYQGGDLWYHFVVPATGAIIMHRSLDGNWGHLSYAIYDLPTDTTEMLCGMILMTESESDIIEGLTPGDTVGLRVWEWGNNDFGPESICLEEVEASGIADNVIEGFSMYPNPVNNLLNLKSNNTINSISIYNMLGQEVLSKTTNDTQLQIDLSNYNTGSYIIKVQAGNQVGSYHFIKN